MCPLSLPPTQENLTCSLAPGDARLHLWDVCFCIVPSGVAWESLQDKTPGFSLLILWCHVNLHFSSVSPFQLECSGQSQYFKYGILYLRAYASCCLTINMQLSTEQVVFRNLQKIGAHSLPTEGWEVTPSSGYPCFLPSKKGHGCYSFGHPGIDPITKTRKDHLT